MDSKIHLGNGSIKTKSHLLKLMKLREISEIMVLLRKSMDLLPMINLFFQNHGEDKKSHIQLMASRTHHGNGLTNQALWPKRQTLETRRLKRESLGSSTRTTACTLLHIQERNMPTMVF
jgi:hypothetical protein